MAIFNPQVQPTNDPNYLGYSKGIEGGYGVDKSGGIALDTAGTVLTEGVSIIDTGIKDYLKDDIRKTVEKERDNYTQYLETLKKVATANKIPGAGDGGDSDSLIDGGSGVDVPDGLQAGLDRAQNLAAAGSTGNKINDTLYTARLKAEAAQLRTDWAGHKDYIDKKFAEYSGMNPANAYYKNLMQDINTLAANANKDKNGAQAIINGAVTAGDVDNADKIWSLHELNKKDPTKGISSDIAIGLVYKARAAKASAEAAEKARVASKGDREATASTATRDFSQEMSDKVQRDMELIQVGSGTQTLKSAIAAMTEMSNNPDKADPKQAQAIVTGMQALRNNIYNGGMARAAERDSSGQTYITRMGGVGKVKEEIEGNLAGLDEYIKSVGNKQWGIGTYLQRAIQAQSEQDQRDLLQDPTMRRGKALQDSFPSYGDIFVKQGLIGNVPEKLNLYLNNERIDAVTQPDFLSSGKPYTMKQTLANIDTKLADPKKYSEADRMKMLNEAFNIPKTIADPNLIGEEGLKMKANIARHAFDPANIGILQNIKMEYTDPVTGRTIPGKYSAFYRMTSPDIVDNLYKIRTAVPDGQEIWANAKTWTQTEFQKLFREDAANLTALNESRLHIGWTSGEGGQPPRMRLLNERGDEVTGVPATYSIGQAMRTVQRVNSAMYNLHQFYRKDGEDTNMPILQDMMQNWTPSEKTTGLPAKIMDAVILANKSKLQKMEDTFHPNAKE